MCNAMRRCSVLLSAESLSTRPAEMKFSFCSLVCFLTLIQATAASAGNACPNSTDPITYNSGEDARLFYNRSTHENENNFFGYRGFINLSLFAFIKKNQSEGTCSGPSKEICLKGKTEFKTWNQSLLIINIFNVTVNDSGLYAVWTSFSGVFSQDDKTEKCFQVIHLKINGNSSETSSSPTPHSTPQSTQVYSSSTTSSGASNSPRALRTYNNLVLMISTITTTVTMSVNPSIWFFQFIKSRKIF
ncbi:uncharacterized protein LOC111341753 [Stylophora pistillata]|uniref:uncharacterized protein LOC111341753 n=1 Tax=Stylophora pistillata TaxID=50429 RepID=UPI000C046D50|nr:uncharacterized protein LOC111341753 [Stylophora pistillata]